MLALRQRKKVVDRKIMIDIPEGFGNEVEVIILSGIDEKKNDYWSKEEIEKMGSIPALKKDIDNEDYSKW